jgi:hypothetical protein
MILEDHVFVANVVVIDLMQKIVALNVINQPIGVATKFNTIIKIHKYKGFHEGHHFIPMAMEVHGSPRHDMDHFIRECAHFFNNKRSRGHLSLSFCIQFSRHHVSIALLHALASNVKRKIVLVMFVLDLPLLLDLMICMQTTL